MILTFLIGLGGLLALAIALILLGCVYHQIFEGNVDIGYGFWEHVEEYYEDSFKAIGILFIIGLSGTTVYMVGWLISKWLF